ncbi:hypothetical protein A4H97_30795 [Niastella yeongjuensis]|uniref:Uncharacterized protein n=1 Tax=Niastella yeongjuensis TaxID=354355 RepID=A0A1V9EPE4_9BACT|nr:hypothetical protein [Niastella yeongjuensis]OQP47755.1 hypothetical protein A4H97_30795 [Niastella yeongjuensis]SEP45486.1 hypothetical protein SAMN05660816_06346 [Niastella yeongjuensis]
MRRINILITIALYISSCSPSEKRAALPAKLSTDDLKFSVTQQPNKDNIVYLSSFTANAIPSWTFEGGNSTLVNDTVIFPFSGEYYIKYGASSGGGFVMGDSVKIKVSLTDLSTIKEQEWGWLTNGQSGKTWELDTLAPIGWYGLDYGKTSGQNWVYHPDYASATWTMPIYNYGSMTFDLDNGKNFKRISLDKTGSVASTCSCKFNLDLKNGQLKLAGCDMLFGGDYFSQSTNWSTLKIIEMKENSMILAVVRDRPKPPDGVCYIGFKFRPK